MRHFPLVRGKSDSTEVLPGDEIPAISDRPFRWVPARLLARPFAPKNDSYRIDQNHQVKK